MSDKFDPYHKWLGIAPTEQPPNYYRLLGLNLFESDLDVIENGSDRQMAHLRSFQTGPRMRECQQLLNEVAAARVTLLDGQKKLAYDQTLRASMVPIEAPPPVASVPLTPADTLLPTSLAATAPPKLVQARRPATATSPVVVPKKSKYGRKQSLGVGTLLIVGVLGLVALLACGYGLRLMLRPRSRPVEPAAGRPAKVSPPAKIAPANTFDATAVTPHSLSTEDLPSRNTASVPTPPASDPGNVLAAPPPAVMPVAEATPVVEPPEPPTPPSSLGDLVNAPATAKLAVPGKADLVAARTQIERLFANDLSKERSPQESATLSEQLLDQAVQSGTQPAMRYAMLEIAVDVAARGGAVASASNAIQALGRTFTVDLVQIKADAAQQIARVAKEPWEHKAVVELLESVIDECLFADRYDLATSLADAANDASRKSKESTVIGRAVARSRDVKSLNAKYEPVRTALNVLTNSPDDAAANETVGRHLCLVKGRWDEGLPYLARSSVSDWRDAASGDLRKPTTPDTQATVGNDWLKVALQLETQFQLQAYLRAEHWLRLAIAQQSGIKRLPLEQQIKDIGKGVGKLAECPTGAVMVMTFEPTTLKRQGYVLDASHHGYVGVVKGAILTDGIAGKALAFDGKNSYVEVASTPWLAAPSAFSLSTWVNVVSWKDPRDAHDYVLSNEAGGARGYVLRYRNGGTVDLTVGARDWHETLSTTKASLEQWHHIGATFDGSVSRVFLDGEVVGETPAPTKITPSNQPFRISQHSLSRDRGIRGRIDEVAVFNRALSPDEVRTVYRIGQAGRPLME
ncbi:MAG: hypothetical protein KDB05_16745 [Planctomycetales bacterium]|nr:hypothetical protein [Planctomycetales bacterium]